MKRKNVFFNGICLRAVLLFCTLFAFSACGDDDEETTPPIWGGGGGGGNTPTTVSIVGNWLSEEVRSDYYLSQLYIFDEDGTYRRMICEVAYGNEAYETEGGSYFVSGDRLTLVEEWNDTDSEPGDAHTRTILSLTYDELVLRGSEGDVYTFERTSRTTLPEPPGIGGGEEQSAIVGNWLSEEHDGDYYLGELYVFSEDGHYRLEYREGYGGNYDTGEEGGEYYYANGNLVLIPSYGVSEEEFADGYTYSVPVLTEDRLVLREEDGDTYVYERTNRTSLFTARDNSSAENTVERTNRPHKKGVNPFQKY